MSYFTSVIKDLCTYTYNEKQRDNYKKCKKYIDEKVDLIEDLLSEVNENFKNYKNNSFIDEKTDSEITDLFSQKSNINIDKVEVLIKYFEDKFMEVAQKKYDCENIYDKYVQNVSLEKEREEY